MRMGNGNEVNKKPKNGLAVIECGISTDHA
jgi:hypothetical protein